MSALLDDPTVVLVVGSAREIESSLLAGRATATVAVSDCQAAVAVLESRADVGCVLLGDIDESLPTACDRLASVTPERPVLVHTADPDASVLADLAARQHCRYLPRSATPDAVREAVDDALSTFVDYRDRAADSDLFRTLLNDAGFSLFAKDDQARYVRTAALAERFETSDIIGRTDRELFGRQYPRAARIAYSDDLAVLETGEPIRERLEPYRNDFWSETTKIPWLDADGSVRGLVGFAFDVTEEVETERELEAQRRRFDQFASYLSHDLRTPLQIASSALELARDGDQESLDKVETALDRIEEIIDDLRQLTEEDLSPESTGLLEGIESIPSTQLRRLVEDIWAVTAPSTATLENEIPTGTVVTAGSEALRPLIENLLKNAVDHVGPDVTVRVGVTHERGFFVADDGPGIPPERHKKVFRKGYTTSEDGTGTGLAIANDTAVKHGWVLSIADDTGSGARFELTDCPVVVPIEVAAGEPFELTTPVDVGDVDTPSSAEYDEAADRWSVQGGGTDLWGDIDEFHFVSATVSGPVRLQGRVVDLDAVHEYSKAGFLVRDDTTDRAEFGYIGQTGSHGSEVIWRERGDQLAVSRSFEEPTGAYPWYRLDRVGQTVTCSVSTNGEEWQPIDQRLVTLADPVSVGLVVCSHDATTSCTARFSDVSVNALQVDTAEGRRDPRESAPPGQ